MSDSELLERAASRLPPEFGEQSKPTTLLRSIVIGVVVVAVCGGVGAFLLHQLSLVAEARHRSECSQNLKNVAVALHNYHDTFRSLPPAIVRDSEGKPLYSWRVLLLPYLDQAELYNQFHLDEPWNSPHNLELLKRSDLQCFHCPGWYAHSEQNQSARGMTNYMAVVGDSTLWPEQGAGSFRVSFESNLSDVLLVTEVNGFSAPWSAPVDLTIQQWQVMSLRDPMLQPNHMNCWGMVMADGSVGSSDFLQSRMVTLPLVAKPEAVDVVSLK